VSRNDAAALERLIASATGSSSVEVGERVQELWSGYGEIRRAILADATPVIVKHVVPPRRAAPNPAAARSHRRKLRSYEVECAFYRTFASRCTEARLPAARYAAVNGDQMLLVLEDLDAAGFGERRRRVSPSDMAACLRWLAGFHACFLGVAPDSLWKVGTYWHLATRPDELGALADSPLRRAAGELDERLNRARFRTLVHGDAKLQNFCFAAGSDAVAAVDFQYVGGGVGVKDLAYFLTSAVAARELTRDAESYVDDYFRELRTAVKERDAAGAWDMTALEAEWRELYPLACADFYRFWLGWAGDAHDPYLESVTRRVLERW
jgi:hypothetical protein